MIEYLPKTEFLQPNTYSTIQYWTRDVICRLFFVRHGVTDQDIISSSSGIQESSAPLSTTGIQEMQAASNKLLTMGCKPEDTLILYSPGKQDPVQRILESKEVLAAAGFIHFRVDHRLDTSQRQKNSHGVIELQDDRVYARTKKAEEILELVNKEIITAFKQQDTTFSIYKNIVLLGHRANATFLQNAKKMGDEITIGSSDIRPGQILESDIGEDIEIIPYHHQKNILWLRNDNVDGILEILKEESGLKKDIEAYGKNINIFELQNTINRFFMHNPHLCEKYLDCGNFDISFYCLGILVRLHRFESIKEKIVHIIHTIDKKYLESRIKSIFDLFVDTKHLINEVQNGNINIRDGNIVIEYIDFFLRIVYVDGIVNDELRAYFKMQCNSDGDTIPKNFFEKLSLNSPLNNFQRHAGQEVLERIDYYENLMKNHDTHIEPQIFTIKNKALDKRFHKGINKPIINNFQISDEKIQQDCLNILENSKISYIEGDGGAGKSFFSAYIQETLKKEYFTHNFKTYFPIFVQLSKKQWAQVQEEIKTQKEYYKDHTSPILYYFESLDESQFCNQNGVENFLTWIKELSRETDRCIITTRYGYIQDGDLKQYSLTGMKDPMKYVKDYFGEDEKKIERYNTLREELGEEYTDKNALFVIILCELINEGGDNVEIINSKRRLFEEITKQRLSKREGKYKPGNYDHTADNEALAKAEVLEISNRYKALEEIAYKKRIQESKSINEEIGAIIEKYNINKDRQSLGFLLKIDDNGSYDFIHKSFESYFLLRYFKERPDALDELRTKPKEEVVVVDTSWFAPLKKRWKELFPGQYSIDHLNYKENILITAIKEGYTEMVEFLANQGYDINKDSNKGREAPFIEAYESGKWEIVEWLYNRIDNINQKGNRGDNVFMCACKDGRLDMVKLFSDKIDDINQKNYEGETGFMIACEHGKLEIVKFLEDKVKNINEKDKEGKTAFIWACYQGELATAQRLSDKADSNEKDNEGRNAFMFACLKGQLEVAQWLADKIDINGKDNIGMSAFMRACLNGKIEIAKRLYEKTGNTNEENIEGTTAFMFACGSGNLELVQRLFDKGEDIYKKGNTGRNALMKACEEGKLEVVQWLADKIDINEKDIDGGTAFMRACHNGRSEVAEWLSTRIDNINEKNNSGTSAFLHACSNGKTQIVQRLYDKIIDTNEEDNEGRNGFIRACSSGREDLAKRLFDRTPDINKKDNDGMTAFMWACIGGRGNIIDRLFDKVDDINERDLSGRTAFMRFCSDATGNVNSSRWTFASKIKKEAAKVDINAKDNKGKTAFIWACLSGDTTMVRTFKELIENINEPDNEGKTGFIWACAKGKLDTAKRLYDQTIFPLQKAQKKKIKLKQRFWGREVDPTIKDNEGRNAFMHACKNGELEVAKWLADKIDINEKDNGGQSAFMIACTNGKLEVIQWLADKVNNINEKDNDGITACMRASLAGQIDIVKWLADKVDINIRDNNGRTTFMWACFAGYIEIAKSLLQNIDNIDDKDNDGISTFMKTCGRGHREIVQWLWENGANINIKDNEGMNAFLYACSKGKLEVAQWLADKVDINEKNNRGINALMLACKYGELEVVKWLSDKIDINKKDNEGMDVFMWACLGGNPEIAERLHDKTEDINQKNTYGSNGLMLACWNGELEIIKWFRTKTENMEEICNILAYALGCACIKGYIDLGERSLKQIDTIDVLEQALPVAETNGQIDIIDMIKERMTEIKTVP